MLCLRSSFHIQILSVSGWYLHLSDCFSGLQESILQQRCGVLLLILSRALYFLYHFIYIFTKWVKYAEGEVRNLFPSRRSFHLLNI